MQPGRKNNSSTRSGQNGDSQAHGKFFPTLHTKLSRYAAPKSIESETQYSRFPILFDVKTVPLLPRPHPTVRFLLAAQRLPREIVLEMRKFRKIELLTRECGDWFRLRWSFFYSSFAVAKQQKATHGTTLGWKCLSIILPTCDILPTLLFVRTPLNDELEDCKKARTTMSSWKTHKIINVYALNLGSLCTVTSLSLEATSMEANPRERKVFHHSHSTCAPASMQRDGPWIVASILCADEDDDDNDALGNLFSPYSKRKMTF